MRFEDLPKAERDALAEYGYEVALDREIEAAVAASRGHGQSWNTIGRALGVTAEAARRRYGVRAAARV